MPTPKFHSGSVGTMLKSILKSQLNIIESVWPTLLSKVKENYIYIYTHTHTHVLDNIFFSSSNNSVLSNSFGSRDYPEHMLIPSTCQRHHIYPHFTYKTKYIVTLGKLNHIKWHEQAATGLSIWLIMTRLQRKTSMLE